MEVTVEDRERLRVRKRLLLTGLGLVVMFFISGLYVYESVKGRDAGMKQGMEAVAAERMAPPPMDEARPGTMETATFALG